MTKQERILAWHFTDGMKLRDGQPLIVGKTYRALIEQAHKEAQK